jgi:hypothetical protein
MLVELDEVIEVIKDTEAETWADLKAIDFITALKDHFCKKNEDEDRKEWGSLFY